MIRATATRRSNHIVLRGGLLALGALALAAPHPLRGQNLIVNGEFDATTDGWSGSHFSWSAEDHAGNPESGSGRLEHPSSPGTSLLSRQCRPVDAGAVYDVAAWLWLPPQEPASGTAFFYIDWYPGPGCTGDVVFGGGPTEVNPHPLWQSRTLDHQIAPPGIASVSVFVLFIRDAGAGPLAVHLDGVSLRRVGPANALANPGFTTGLSGWSTGSWTTVWESGYPKGTPGGALCSGAASGPEGRLCLSQCAAVDGGESYDFGINAAGLVTPTVDLTLAVAVNWYAGAGCAGNHLGQAFVEAPQPDFWEGWLMLSRRGAGAPPGARSARFLVELALAGAGSAQVLWDDAFLRPAASGPCLAGDASLCLNSGRFRVEATWETADGASGAGHAVPLTADTGYFWFFAAANVEVVVKVLDACGPFERFWVFASGLTDVGVVLEVTDTLSGEVRVYENPLGRAYPPLQDTDAFATCP
jgi:hypothetical protein